MLDTTTSLHHMIARLRAQLAVTCHACRVRLIQPMTPPTASTVTFENPISTVRYLTDDRDHEIRHELCITMGGNGDWYVSVVKEGDAPVTGVRISTSGGAASAAPGLGVAIAQAFRALLGKTRPQPREPKRYTNLALDDRLDPSFIEIDSHKLDADDDGYRWVPNPAYDQASYELDPRTGDIVKRHD
jgi:hypothetical protein